jgi:hypothetical protein
LKSAPKAEREGGLSESSPELVQRALDCVLNNDAPAPNRGFR